MFGAAYCGTMLETALTKESGFRPMRRNVVMWSFPLTKMEPRISKVYHSLRTCMHLSGTWIRPCTPVIKENKIICIGLSNNFCILICFYHIFLIFLRLQGCIQVPERCMHILSKWYTFEMRGFIFVKGKKAGTSCDPFLWQN